ncbi:glycosyltransferase family 4 protein [Christensenellaceae bacterium OttesenSCG-928-M15]|nr:glycosyltransferase family 4 protein [Christensenellaceae bacterium OttesenSCG-928-M15]
MGKSRVVHIAVHMGEGVGKAIGGLAVADTSNRHEIVVLEQPHKMGHIAYCRENGVAVTICPDNEVLAERVAHSDVVVVNWWNHPSLLVALRELCDMPSRMMLWSHVNGLHYPLLPAKFASAFEACLFTSPISLRSPHWTSSERETILGKSELVYGMGEYHPQAQPCKKTYALHDPIRIGYVGTLDYAKLHPQFVSYCKAVLERGIHAQFLLAGEPSSSLVADVQRNNLTEHISFLGFQKNIPELLISFDLFGYLLNPRSFATTENALLEAMAAGLPIITSNGDAEGAIITDGMDGFVVADAAAYADKIVELMQSDSLRSRLGIAARDSVCKKYNVAENIGRFDRTIFRVSEKNKTKHDFALGDEAFDWFLSCCPEKARALFLETVVCDNDIRFDQLKSEANSLGDIFRAKQKGSAFQFSRYFPADKKMQKICELYE